MHFIFPRPSRKFIDCSSTSQPSLTFQVSAYSLNWGRFYLYNISGKVSHFPQTHGFAENNSLQSFQSTVSAATLNSRSDSKNAKPLTTLSAARHVHLSAASPPPVPALDLKLLAI